MNYVQEVVPERSTLESEDVFSDKALLHREAKRILGNHEDTIDTFILENEIDTLLVKALQEGNVLLALTILHEAVLLAVEFPSEEKEVLDAFFAMAQHAEYPLDRLAHIATTFDRAEDPRLLLGNSVLVVLKKKENK